VPGDFVNHLAFGLYVPPGEHAGCLPLVVMLHGCKQSAEEFAQGTRMNVLADQHRFAVLYPEQSKHAQPHRCWRWYDTSRSAGGGEADAIASLVRSQLEQHDFDPARVYVAGMSAGAGMAALLAVRYPMLFAAAGLHSGVVLGDANSAINGMNVMRRGSLGNPVALLERMVDLPDYPGMPAILLHGESDNVVAPVNLDQLEQQFIALNRLADPGGEVASTDVEQPSGDHRRDYVRGRRRLLRVCRIPGLSHAWSGGDAALPFHSAHGPEASALLWDFFRLQRRALPVTEQLATQDSADQ
jgi:poly(hydroxyalkanoate) depolymerase family esterase